MMNDLVGANTQTLKKINKSLVLSTIHSHSPISRSEIARISHLSLATVANMTTELLKEGLIVETGYNESSGGRRSALIEINPEGAFLVGVELGETRMMSLVTNIKLETKVLKKMSLNERENQPNTIISAITTSVQSALVEANISPQKVLGIGIGVPGLVQRDKGISIFAPNWGWHNVHIKEKIEEALGIATYVDNGAKVMALGEKWFGAARGANNVIALILGTGLGAGVIVNGKMCRGASESAGEWGHMVINFDGPECCCGNRGCLEAYAGAHAIARRAREALKESADDSVLRQFDTMQKMSAHDIIKAAKEKDSFALRILKDTAHYLGIDIANLVNLFNPEVIIIGGFVGIEAGKILLPVIQSTVQKHALDFPLRSSRIVLSELADRSIVIGGVTVVLRKFLQPTKIRNIIG